MSRRALLLGIGDYDDKTLTIPAAANDVAAVEDALKCAGFPASAIAAHREGLTTPRSRKLIREFLKNATSEDHLFLYFSGHGAVLHGKRILIPTDYDNSEPASLDTLVSDFEIYLLARSSPAASVVVFLDACREGVQLKLVGDKGPESSIEPDAETPAVAVVHSCEDDRKSFFDSGKDGFSHFTEAFCQVIRQSDGPASLGELLNSIATKLDLRRKGQRPRLGEHCPGRAGHPKELLIKDDVAARLEQQIRDSEWCQHLRESLLFKKLDGHRGLQRQVECIVLRCHQPSLKPSVQRWIDGRWDRPRPARRVLDVLDLLLKSKEGRGIETSVELTPPETALILQAPFVYEAVLALARETLSQWGDPLDTQAPAWDGANQPDHLCRTWRTAFIGDARWRRRRELTRSDQSQYGRDVSMWQLLRFLHRSGELWQAERDTTKHRSWIGNRIAEIAAPGPFPEIARDHRVIRALPGELLVRLARFLFCSYEDIELEYVRESEIRSDSLLYVGEGSEQWTIDLRKVAHLVSLAGRMALDARRLPDAPADHIGIDPGVHAESLVRNLEEAEWHRGQGDEVSLSLVCFHQALDLALDSEVQSVGRHLRRLRERESRDSWVRGLPSRATAQGVRPRQDSGVNVYQRPHLRFQLDPERIRELLMGRNLYGDPMYALREAFQNALDACRYRRARAAFLGKRATADAMPAYDPRISIRAGADEGGRQYVECIDNGIGMDRRHLEGLFARAGERFVDSHEFHLEKAAWDEAGIPFWANSRFGIGVLAYFMLAEEVVVWTRRIGEYGNPEATAIKARILSGSDLFRVVVDPGACPDGGTRVRLYLDRRWQDRQGSQILHSVLDWLHLPEVAVELIEGERLIRRLAPGELFLSGIWPRSGKHDSAFDLCFPVGPRDPVGQYRVYCLIAEDAPSADVHRSVDVDYLADGIRVGNRGRARLDRDERGILIVANLKGSTAPALSVDRNRIIDKDAGEAWLKRELRQYLFPSAAASDQITFGCLSLLAASYPLEAHQFNQALGSLASSPVIPFSKDKPVRLRLSDLGVSQVDAMLARREFLSSEDQHADFRDRGEMNLSWTKSAGTVLHSRLNALHRYNVPLPNAFASLAAYDSERGKTPPKSLGQELLTLLSDKLEAIPPFHDHLPIQRLLSAAAHWEVSLGEVVEVAKHLSTAGVKLPPLDGVDLFLRPSNRIADLLIRDAEGTGSWASRISRRRLLGTAAKWNLNLGQVVKIAKPLGNLGIALPSLDGIDLSFVPSERAAELLTDHTDHPGLWENQLTSSDIVNAAAGWEVSVEKVVEIARTLAAVGVRVPSLDGIDLAFQPSGKASELLSVDLDGSAPWVRRLTLGHLVKAAAAWGIPMGGVVEIAKQLPGVGAELPSFEGVDLSFQPGERLAELLSRDLDGARPWVERLTLVHLAKAAAEWEISIQDVAEIAKPLTSLGITLPTLTSKEASFRPDGRTAEWLSLGLYAVGSREISITEEHLVRSVAKMRMPIQELLKLLRPLTKFGYRVPANRKYPPNLSKRLEFPAYAVLDNLLRYRKNLTPLFVAIAVENSGIELADVPPVLDHLELLGIDVRECREFVSSARPRKSSKPI